MKLYYSPGACSLAPHIVAREAGLDLDLAQVDLAAKTIDGRDYREINPKSAVPALELDGGELLTENAVILQYLADRAPYANLVPGGGIERWRLLELLNFIATELHKGFSPLFNPAMPAEARRIFVDNLAKRFNLIELPLGRWPHLTGEAFTIADAYAFTVLSWAAFLQVDLGNWPNIQAFLQRVVTRPRVQQALQEEGLAT